jgi:redox-sensitive bicupin YhaK (pirin superfamily)
MITLRKSTDRGRANHGWLDTRHTFSFADYHDPRHVHFRALRVINEDFIAAGMGFPTHPHRDMEIFSYVISGALEHQDSMGNGRVLKPGQIQLMSAGRGVEHSEFNPLPGETTHMLQIWIFPERKNLEPGYTEWHPPESSEQEPKVLMISRDGRDGSAVIHQDADVWRVRLPAGGSVGHELAPGRGAWLQVVSGKASLNGTEIIGGDGAAITQEPMISLEATVATEALLMDLA